jgi:hypothetical protein
MDGGVYSEDDAADGSDDESGTLAEVTYAQVFDKEKKAPRIFFFAQMSNLASR